MTWREWINAGKRDRRILIVQTINALRLSYQWQSLDKSVQNLEMLKITPEGSPEAIQQAVELCARLSWDKKAVRNDLR